jgi:hypothetical protein
VNARIDMPFVDNAELCTEMMLRDGMPWGSNTGDISSTVFCG